MPRIYQPDPRSKKYMKPNQNDLKNAIITVKKL
ncbi:HTH psq-type domain-containing protein, partial [Aphis craccivora]